MRLLCPAPVIDNLVATRPGDPSFGRKQGVGLQEGMGLLPPRRSVAPLWRLSAANLQPHPALLCGPHRGGDRRILDLKAHLGGVVGRSVMHDVDETDVGVHAVEEETERLVCLGKRRVPVGLECNDPQVVGERPLVDSWVRALSQGTFRVPVCGQDSSAVSCTTNAARSINVTGG